MCSILLAFGIDAWWDGFQERRDEGLALVGLVEDFAANRDGLGETISFHQGFLDRLYRLEGMSAAELAATPQDSVAGYILALDGKWTFDAQDGTLEGLIATGKLGLLRDAEVRRMLISWKAKVDDLAEEAEESRVGATRASDRIAALGGPWSGSESGPLGITPGLREALSRFPHADLTVVAQDEELRSLLRLKRLASIVYLAELIPLLERAEEVLRRLAGAQP